MADPRKSWRIPSGTVQREPYASRTHCSRGHRWTPSTERWRARLYPSGAVIKERDCLVCKRESEAKRRRKNDRLTGVKRVSDLAREKREAAV